MPGYSNRRTQRGFTLVEMLIALVLMALVAGVLFGSLRLAGRSWEVGEQRLEDGANARAAQQFLRAHLAQQYPLRMRRDAERPLFFAGERDSIRFASVLPDRVVAGGTLLLRVSLIRDGQRSDLVLERAIPDGPVTPDFAFDRAERSILAADVEKVRIAYFGQESDTEEPRWLDRWSDAQRMPRLIRLDIDPRRGAPWPSLVVEPRLSLEAGCRNWNPAVRRCLGP
jgi:general secretion pathway protein J